jgi:hypothetical protein
VRYALDPCAGRLLLSDGLQLDCGGVLDTGVQCVHPDLADNIWVNLGEIDGDDVDDDGNGWVDDIHGADCISNDGVPTASASSG